MDLLDFCNITAVISGHKSTFIGRIDPIFQQNPATVSIDSHLNKLCDVQYDVMCLNVGSITFQELYIKVND